MLKVLCEGCTPTKGSEYSAGIDLYASEDVVIMAGETAVVGLGVCIDLKKLLQNFEEWKIVASDREIEHFKRSHYLELHPRSSLRAKGLISNTGIIDIDYKDEIKIIIHNPITLVDYDKTDNTMYQYGSSHLSEMKNMQEFHIKKGDKIAQILLKEHKGFLMGIESIEERVGGFGSTGL